MIDDPHWPRADQWLARGDESPEMVVVGVPTSSSSLVISEAWRAPEALRQTLGRFSTFHSEAGIDLGALSVRDLGDWPIAELDPWAAFEFIRESAGDVEQGPVHVFAGGDNAITAPLVIGLAGADLARVGVLTFDAHHDVRLAPDAPTNGSPMRLLVEAGLPDGHVAQVGPHTFSNSAEYRAYCEEHSFLVLPMDTVEEWGITEATEAALQHLSQRADWIYVDFDLDVLDAASAPGCPGARPGGMTPRQLTTAALICGRHPQVSAADLVEVDPTRDDNELTMMAMASVFMSFAAGVADRVARREAA